MIRKYLPLVSLLVALSILLVPVMLFGDTYTYYIPVSVFNNSTNVYGEIPVLVTLNNSQLATWGYINSTGLNTNLIEGADQVYMVATPRLGIYAPSFAPGQVRTYYYRLNNLPGQTGFPIIAGVGGNMTVADDPTLELGNNFTVSMDGYIDTSAGSFKDLVRKLGAFRLYVGTNGTVTGTVGGTAVMVNMTPDGAGDYTNIMAAVPAVAHYLNVDDPPGTPDNAATLVWSSNAAQEKDSYNMTASGIPSDSLISSVEVVFGFREGTGVGTAYGQPYLRLNGVETVGTERSEAAMVWTTFTEVLARPGGGFWAVSDLLNLQVGIGLRGAGGGESDCTQVFTRVNYAPSLSVTAAGVASGEHLISVATNTTWMSISVDGIQRDQIWLGTNVTVDNGNTWYFMSGNGMVYMDSARIDSVATNSTLTPTAAMLSQLSLGAWNAAQLVDSNVATQGFNTNWSGPGAYMRIDFGAGNSKELTGWGYYVDGAVAAAIWNIQYSDNGIAWTTAYTGLNVFGTAGWHECSWGSVGSHRYWQSYKTDAVGGGGGSSHTELVVYGRVVAERGWWESTYMVAPTNVVDRTGNGNVGTINWGTNPAPLEITVGELTASMGGEMPGGAGGEVPEIFKVPTGLEIYENSTATGYNLPLHALFERAGTSLGWSTSTTYFFIGMLIPSIAMTFAVGIATGNLLIGVIFGALMLAVAAGTGIVAPWIPATIVIVIIALLYAARRT